MIENEIKISDETSIGLNISELEYRALPYPSYSLLSDIAKHGGDIVNSPKNEDISELDGIMLGKLVDNILTENKTPDNFYIVKKKPVGKVKDLLKVLSKTRQYHPDKDNLLAPENHDLIHKCCDTIGYYNTPKSKSKRIDGLRNYTEYYEVLNKAPYDSFIISEYINYQAKKCVKVIEEFYPFIKDGYMGHKVIPQVKLVGEFNGTKIKGMLDFVVINDKNKIITPFDLKTGSGKAEDFYLNGYIGWNYYIQSALYYKLFCDEVAKHPIYKDYMVDDFRFLYVSRMDFSHSVMCVISIQRTMAKEGFNTVDGEVKKGVDELINEYNRYKIVAKNDDN